jgi:hypothetical protein
VSDSDAPKAINSGTAVSARWPTRVVRLATDAAAAAMRAGRTARPVWAGAGTSAARVAFHDLAISVQAPGRDTAAWSSQKLSNQNLHLN